MREVEKQCARNCIRKFDKGYKLLESVQGQVLEDYFKENNIMLIHCKKLCRKILKRKYQRTWHLDRMP